ncbi:phage portal protein, partial [Ottowia sp.]|uniref:phage portal protein n=1 Tax=Ottowia sp. TaxID=1898956 RepID=UPI003A85676F
GWATTDKRIDDELRGDLDRLRGRSRQQTKDHEHAAQVLRLAARNMVGPAGPRLTATIENAPGQADKQANWAIEVWWADFCRAENFDVAGRISGHDAMRLLVRSVARDGEAILRHVVGRGKHGYQVQILDISRLDTGYNLEPANGRNAVVMGVEVDRYSRPVAYWLREGVSRRRERVPAAEILHVFLPTELEQTRGVPWMHAALRRLNDLGAYREAAIINARIGANKVGFYTRSIDAVQESIGGVMAEGEEAQLITNAEPGEFHELPAGYSFESFNPAYPNEQFEVFHKAMLRGVAAGMGVSYTSLSGDLEGVNFSSIRAGLLDERDEWKALQEWFIAAVVDPIFTRALQMALLKGTVRTAGGAPLPAAKTDKFMSHRFQGRRWPWVDPVKDMQAAILARRARLASATMQASEMGVDIEDVLADLQREQALADSYGVAMPEASEEHPATDEEPVEA